MCPGTGIIPRYHPGSFFHDKKRPLRRLRGQSGFIYWECVITPFRSIKRLRRGFQQFLEQPAYSLWHGLSHGRKNLDFSIPDPVYYLLVSINAVIIKIHFFCYLVKGEPGCPAILSVKNVIKSSFGAGIFNKLPGSLEAAGNRYYLSKEIRHGHYLHTFAPYPPRIRLQIRICGKRRESCR
jgi:hypothetical protein